MGSGVPQESGYLQTGRAAQKRRTLEALIAAARQELAAGRPVTVESAASAAGISRTTAYRYFANHRDLVAAAHPQIDAETLLPDPAPDDPAERLSLVMHAFIHDVTLAWEPQLRAALHLALAPRPAREGDDAGTLRQGRGIRWIVEALEPLSNTHPGLDVGLLARAVRSAAGIEALVWLTDVGGMTREQAAEVMHASAMAIYEAAVRRQQEWPSA
jgi:AcrR family transcriptional regulator